MMGPDQETKGQKSCGHGWGCWTADEKGSVITIYTSQFYFQCPFLIFIVRKSGAANVQNR